MKTILLIEDNEEVRENTAEILELASYKVLTAPNGKVGVELAQKERPDLIISDIMMPELDGFGVLHVLNKSRETAQIPFIFLTAKSDRSDFRRGMNLGADDYITKPFDDVELLDAVESRLKKVSILQQEYDPTKEGLNDFLNHAKTFEDLSKLSDNRKVRHYKKKNHVFMEGDAPVSLMFINSGKVKTYKTNEDGKELITGLHKVGDFIGYTDLMQDSNYHESAMALEDTEISLIPKQDFYTLLYNNRDVANRFIRILSNNISDNEERLLHLAYNTVRQRVAEALVTLAERYSEENPEELFSISREDLANMVGTAPESVIRTLSDFKSESVITIESSEIRITDAERLKRIIKWNR
jgi:CRP-like cAMP-binding protein/CheY-like chemotaxis protein